MGALLQFFGFRPHEKVQERPEDECHDITDDQIAHAHELADERRRVWAQSSDKR